MLAVALALQILLSGGLELPPGELPGWARPEAPALAVLRVHAVAPPDSGNPACRAEFCQPRVAIPGRDASFDTKGKRTELALAAIDRLLLVSLSDVPRAASLARVPVDYVPPHLDAWSGGR
ncbi:MAG TPA: hypothetical protein PLL32_08310, partial [Anaeromyxobacteraceae bacterium]|nr:hypothetical protein [Anaeromyxobacteraceae bacterium]